jgi:hypothetical protein
MKWFMSVIPTLRRQKQKSVSLSSAWATQSDSVLTNKQEKTAATIKTKAKSNQTTAKTP